MQLIQVLLPLYDNRGDAFSPELFSGVRLQLTERFGGVTAFSRSPARGLWKDEDGAVARDDVVIYEVMAEYIDDDWWATYREQLRRAFDQEELIVRALPCRLL